ncbi:LacI family DNA-binding transcriptional regulator [Gordonia sp. VNQ95]|uniref:LacI family DNA-binding transcriptional regulator n=1 Tax=Gordonia TaxID=2053 RepID=UPI0032B595AA
MTANGDTRRRRTTMADVAAHAGVSRTLVSFILDGKPGASESTRQRVLAAAEELDYRPDSAARMLARGRSRTLGVVIDVAQLFEAELVADIYPAAEALGYDVLLSASLPGRAEDVAGAALLDHRCGALILLGPSLGAERIEEMAGRAPTVVVGRCLPPALLAGTLAASRTDDAVGMRLAVDYLADLGHRDIVHVDGGGEPGSAERREGYRVAMVDRGLGDRVAVVAGAHDERAGAHAAREILARNALPTAVIAGNDRCALGILDVFTREGVDVPGEVSLVGYDDSKLSDNPRIDLTTIHQDAPALAREAVRLATGMVEGAAIDVHDVVLQPSLKVRGTTAGPR